MTYKLVFKDANGNEYLDDRFYYENGVMFIKGVDVRFGNGEHVMQADMEFDAANNKLWVKEGAQFHSKDDSIDIGSGRAGNNGVAGALMTTLANMRIGWNWWRSFVSGAPTETQGWNGGANFNQFSFCAAIDGQTDGEQTATSRPGLLTGYVTRPGEIAGTKAWRLQNPVAAGETFERLSWRNAAGDLVLLDRVCVDANGFLRVAGIGVPVDPPPFTPPTGAYRFLRIEVSKIISPNTVFRMIDAQWSADGGATWWPSMTANNAPAPFVASASTETSVDPAWEGMDGNWANTILGTTQTSDASGNLSPKVWLQVDLGAGNGLTPNRFRYVPYAYNGDRTIVEGRVLGSTTGAFAGEEVVLKTITGETAKPHAQPVTYNLP